MKALAVTTLTLAFILMAAITYVAVHQDPMGGEPRLVVKIAPPDMAKLQVPAVHAIQPTTPETEGQTGLTVDLGAAASDATPVFDAPAVVADAPATAAAVPAVPKPVGPAKSAADAAAAATGVEGVNLSLPN